MSAHPAACDLHTMSVRARAFGDVGADLNRQWVTASTVRVGDRVDVTETGPTSTWKGGGIVAEVVPTQGGKRVNLILDNGEAWAFGRNSRLWHSTAAQVDHLADAS